MVVILLGFILREQVRAVCFYDRQRKCVEDFDNVTACEEQRKDPCELRCSEMSNGWFHACSVACGGGYKTMKLDQLGGQRALYEYENCKNFNVSCNTRSCEEGKKNDGTDGSGKVADAGPANPLPLRLIIVIVALIIISLAVVGVMVGYFAVVKPRRKRARVLYHKRGSKGTGGTELQSVKSTTMDYTNATLLPSYASGSRTTATGISRATSIRKGKTTTMGATMTATGDYKTVAGATTMASSRKMKSSRKMTSSRKMAGATKVASSTNPGLHTRTPTSRETNFGVEMSAPESQKQSQTSNMKKSIE